MQMAEKWPEMVLEWPTHNVVTVFLKQMLYFVYFNLINKVGNEFMQ